MAENEQIENMEGAAFFYVSLLRHIPFLCFRSISNVVEPRDKANWKMAEAIASLNRSILEWLEGGDWKTDKLFARRGD
jgi:futalosine hydrolase